MPLYHIGIDFGTSQTKICSSNMNDNTLNRNYIFHKFSKSSSYLLPSTIGLDSNGKLVFGAAGADLISYFKMKALFDENPRYSVSREHSLVKIKNQDELAQYPEICCILYLSYCIGDVKKSFKETQKEPSPYANPDVGLGSVKTKTSIFSRLFGKPKVEKVSVQEANAFLITIGIPTEYDYTQENYRRRCKQYEMLYLALQLANKITNIEELVDQPMTSLLNIIRTEYQTIIHQNAGQRLTQEYYEKEKGLFVIAETTAGIIPLRKQLQVSLDSIRDVDKEISGFKNAYMGNYMTMDVGAGTTDVSFFNFYILNRQIRMKYYASKSIEEASNYLILNYLDSDNLNDVINFDLTMIDIEYWNKKQMRFREHLFDIIRRPESNLFSRVRSIFINKVRQSWHYENSVAKGCKVYGGGCRFSEFSRGELMLDSAGLKEYSPNLQTYTQLQKFINANEVNFNLVYPNGKQIRESERKEILSIIDILYVALGLAMVDPKNRPDDWIEDKVDNKSIRLRSDDGMAMYDIFNRDWI